MNFLRYTAYVLTLIGALNWGLVGAFDFNLVTALLGEDTLLTKITYILVGISALAFMFSAASDIFEKHEY